MTPKLCQKQTDFSGEQNKCNFIKISEFKNYYKVCDLIGRGSYGCVYSGVCVKNSKCVAIKHIDKNRVIDWHQIRTTNDRIPVEIYLMQKLKNIPGIIQILEWFETDHSYLIIMERPHNSIDLFELKKVKTNYKFSEFEVKSIVKQLLETLENCLKMGVIHRDIKPENILINPDSFAIKLIDFGAGGYNSETDSDQFRGTAQYCPPEYLLQNKSDYGEPQMVWSLGILLYELICGELPFESEEQILNNKSSVILPKTTSKEFKNLIQKCLSRNPLRRPSIKKILSNHLFNV